MTYIKHILPICTLVSVLSISCHSKKDNELAIIENYKPKDIELQHTIEALDSIFFTAYNTCNIEVQEQLISEDLEFFHDKGGLSTSKQDIIEGLKNNICGKVTRELIKGSIEVYAINNYGAVEMGYHKFYNNQEPNAISKPSKFINIWKNDLGNWKLTRVISLHND